MILRSLKSRLLGFMRIVRMIMSLCLKFLDLWRGFAFLNIGLSFFGDGLEVSPTSKASTLTSMLEV